MPGSLTDLTGIDVSAEDFLAAVLEATAQPVWVMDHEELIRFANPAALAALGYDAGELFGRHSHATIHHSRPDGTPYPAEDCLLRRPIATGRPASSELDWFFRRDGSMFPVTYVSVPIDMPNGRGAVVAFSDIEDRLRSEQAVLAREADLEGQQAALRRVASLVAGGAEGGEVLAAVAREVAQVLDMPIVQILRYERDDTLTVMGGWSEPNPFVPGSSWPRSPGTIAEAVYRTRDRVRIEDLTHAQGAFADCARDTSRVVSGAGAPIVVGGELWGVVGAAAPQGVPLPPGLEDRLAEFTDLLATAIANTESREQLSRLADEQAALRRVATLVAEGASPQETFDAVAREVDELLGTSVTDERIGAFTELAATAIANTEARTEVRQLADEQAALRRVATMVARGVPADALFASVVEEVGSLLGADAAAMVQFDRGRSIVTLAIWSADGNTQPIPEPQPLDGQALSTVITRTGEPARVNDWSDVEGPIATIARDQMGLRSSVGAPVVVEGAVWGAIYVHSRSVVLPPATESRLGSFAELVITAITDSQARGELRRLIEEQAALRRVATLVANEAAPDEVFNAVAEELGGLLGVEDTRMVRYEPDDTATVVASASRLSSLELVGKRVALRGTNLVTRVQRTGRSARVDDHSDATGRVGEYARMVGARSSVGTPIIVGGRVWGAMILTSGTGPLPAETEDRSAEFTELMATAIANIEARTELAASRARALAAADDERRRVVRDVHDGAQQRMVHTVVTLKLAARALADDREQARELLRSARESAESANAELRELAQGILPAVLTRGGLSAGVAALASRMPVPVQVDVPDIRLSPAVEATGYFVVAEALTNVAKHARANRATVSAWVDDDTLRVEVRDDGAGGARAAGSGLVGLRDRVAALDGDLVLHSEPGAGTLVAAEIPLRAAGARP